MRGLKTLAYLLILVALAISQPAQLLCQAYICFDADGHPLTLLIGELLPLGDHNTATEQDSDCLLWVEKGSASCTIF